MILSKVPVDAEKVLKDAMIVAKGRVSHGYINGVRGEVDGIKYDCIFPNLDYEKIPIKVLGERNPSINYVGTPIRIGVINPKCKLYQDFKGGGIKMTITVDSIFDKNSTVKIKKEG